MYFNGNAHVAVCKATNSLCADGCRCIQPPIPASRIASSFPNLGYHICRQENYYHGGRNTMIRSELTTTKSSEESESLILPNSSISSAHHECDESSQSTQCSLGHCNPRFDSSTWSVCSVTTYSASRRQRGDPGEDAACGIPSIRQIVD